MRWIASRSAASTGRMEMVVAGSLTRSGCWGKLACRTAQPLDERLQDALDGGKSLRRLQVRFVHVERAVDLELQHVDTLRRPAIGLRDITAGIGIVAPDLGAAFRQGGFGSGCHPFRA